MKKEFNVLIIDDHPLICDAYKNALIRFSSIREKYIFNTKISTNCDDAFLIIQDMGPRNKLDLIFLDIKLPPSENKKILSGEDLGIKIRELLPDSKIVISTSFNDNYRINAIMKNVDPDGFLIKDEISMDDLLNAIEDVISNPPFYSKTVIKFLRKQISVEYTLDKIDRQLLYELSIGTKMKELPGILPLSIAGIEKRKRKLKEIFNTQTQNDRELILNAMEKGFI